MFFQDQQELTVEELLDEIIAGVKDGDPADELLDDLHELKARLLASKGK